MTRIEVWTKVAGMGAVLLLAACGTETAGGTEAAVSAVATESTAQSTTPPTGTVIEVKMHTDGEGNYFEPKDISAKPGDVIRFVLVTGVHNVSFPAASNSAAATLPQSSPYLQLPGQTHDLPVELPAGEYTFQCDPHAALGMVGTLTVQ